jgi:phosphoribosylaminoimidazole carboxylase
LVLVVNILGAPSGGIERTMKGVNAAMCMSRAVVHWYGKEYRPGRKMGHINITADSHAELDDSLAKLLEVEGIGEDVLPEDGGIGACPLVGVIMGSHSDLPTMQDAVKVLKEFGIPHEVDIVSAHRTPEKLMTYSQSAAGRGLQVIIAGAGGAAHLPGMVAAMTPLPVIGVPIKTSTLNGQDSLLSIVQMPRGVPVATVAIGNATNAGLLAVRSLCASRPKLREKMEEYQLNMKKMVEEVSASLLEQGSDKFLEGMGNASKSVNV